jgi:hypothetical protein
MKYKVSQEDLQKILDYLQQKPYFEVHELINIIIKIANEEE